MICISNLNNLCDCTTRENGYYFANMTKCVATLDMVTETRHMDMNGNVFLEKIGTDVTRLQLNVDIRVDKSGSQYLVITGCTDQRVHKMKWCGIRGRWEAYEQSCMDRCSKNKALRNTHYKSYYYEKQFTYDDRHVINFMNNINRKDDRIIIPFSQKVFNSDGEMCDEWLNSWTQFVGHYVYFMCTTMDKKGMSTDNHYEEIRVKCVRFALPATIAATA